MKSSTQASVLLFIGSLANLLARNLALQNSQLAHQKLSSDLEIVPLSLSTGAACLDGSAYFFMIKSGSRDHWTIQFGRGGECRDAAECEEELDKETGSSKHWDFSRAGEECECGNVDEEGNYLDCTCIMLPYCDGSYFTGYVEEPVKSPSGADMYLRGRKNLETALDLLLDQHGMGNASDILVQGLSSGGLSTILNLDNIAKKMPSGVSVRGKPESGFTIIHSTTGVSDPLRDTRLPSEYPYQAKKLQSIYDFHKSYQALSPACMAEFTEKPFLCLVASHAARYVEAPLFIMNSHYDPWQLTTGIYGLSYKAIWQDGAGTRELLPEVLKYGEDWQKAFGSFMDMCARRNLPHGAFIQSCFCHGNCRSIKNSWYKGTPMAKLYGRWYNGVVEGTEPAVYFDWSPPNYDCPLTNTDWTSKTTK